MKKIKRKYILAVAALLSAFLAFSQTIEERFIRTTFNTQEFEKLYKNAESEQGLNRVEPCVALVQYYYENTNRSWVPDSVLALFQHLDLDTKKGAFASNPFPLLYLKLQVVSSQPANELGSMKVSAQILALNQALSVKDSLIVYNNLYYAYQKRGLYHFQLDLIPTMARLTKKADFGEYHWYPKSIWYAKIYYDLGYKTEAVFGYKECAQVALDSNDLYMHNNFLNNVGVVYKKHLEFDSALFYFKTCEKQILAYLKPTSIERDTALLKLVRNNMADCFLKLGATQKALKIYTAQGVEGASNTLTEDEIYRLVKIAKCYLKLGNLPMAKTYLNQGENLLGNEKNIRLAMPFYKGKLAYAEAIGDFKEAFMWQQKVATIQDSIHTNFERQRTVALSAMSLFETRKKEVLVAQNKAAKIAIDLNAEQQKVNQERQKTMWLIALSLALLALLAAAFLAYKRKQKNEFKLNEKSQELARSKLEIEQSLAEKNTLLKEVHHRVKNNLQVISSILQLQSFQAKTTELKLGLEESQKRIQAMYLVHQKLYDNNMLDAMPIGDYLMELCQGVAEGLKPDGFQLALEVNCGSQKFNLDTSIPLGLVVNELMTNSLKHAFKNKCNGNISLSLTKVNDHFFELIYKDNGLGMPKEVKLAGIQSLGLKLVQILAQQLKGSITYTYQQGAQFNLRFKA